MTTPVPVGQATVAFLVAVPRTLVATASTAVAAATHYWMAPIAPPPTKRPAWRRNGRCKIFSN